MKTRFVLQTAHFLGPSPYHRWGGMEGEEDEDGSRIKRVSKQQKGAWQRLPVLSHTARQHPQQQFCHLKTTLPSVAYCLNSASLGMAGGLSCAHPGGCVSPRPVLFSQCPHAEHEDLHHLFCCQGSHSAYSPFTDYTKTAKPAKGHMAMTYSMPLFSPKTNISYPSCDQGPTETALPESNMVVVD